MELFLNFDQMTVMDNLAVMEQLWIINHSINIIMSQLKCAGGA
jgi:hypothetical protein